MNGGDIFRKLCCFLMVCLVAFPMLAQSVKGRPFSVKAFLPNWEGGLATLKLDGITVQADTVRRNLFSYNGTTESFRFAVLEVRRSSKSIRLPFLLEPGTLRIRQEGPIDLAAFGSPLNDTINGITRLFDSLTRARQLSVQEAADFQGAQAATFIREHPASPVSVFLMLEYRLLNRSNDSLIRSLFEGLDPGLQQSYAGQQLQKRYGQRWQTATGQVAPLFRLADTARQPVPLYDTGRYTLIDFWASWCAPCRREHPSLKKIFEKFAPGGFQIVSVSLDGSRVQWLQAIRMDSLTWRQLNDPLAFNSPVARAYSVRLIPTNFLLDPTGRIIGHNLSPAVLERRLGQLLR